MQCAHVSDSIGANCSSHLAIKNSHLALLEAESKLNSKLIGTVSVLGLPKDGQPKAIAPMPELPINQQNRNTRACNYEPTGL